MATHIAFDSRYEIRSGIGERRRQAEEDGAHDSNRGKQEGDAPTKVKGDYKAVCDGDIRQHVLYDVPACVSYRHAERNRRRREHESFHECASEQLPPGGSEADGKRTRLNSRHLGIWYA